MSESTNPTPVTSPAPSRWPMIRGGILILAGVLLITGQVLKIGATSRLSELRREEVRRVSEETRQVAAEARKAAPAAVADRAERNAAEVASLLENYRDNIDLQDKQLQYTNWLYWAVAMVGVGYGLYEVIRAARAARQPPDAATPAS